MPKYTIKSVTSTGKAPHPTYGTEYIVQLNEDDRSLTISRKSEPQVNDTLDGDIVEDKYGVKFKKAPYVPGQATSTGQTPAVPRKGNYKDNSDGQRQGMCFNNAANFVNNQVFEKTLNDEQWAELVFRFAKALYRKGNLDEEAEIPLTDVVPADVAALFSMSS